MVGPASRAVQQAQSGVRYPIPEDQLHPGTLVWMPWAGVIKVTHAARRRELRQNGIKCGSADGDGVEIVSGSGAVGVTEGRERPRRRAWNHPAVIVKRVGEKVWILPLTSFKSRSLSQKFDKFPDRVKEALLSRIIPVEPASEHPFFIKRKDTRYKTLTLASAGGLARKKKLPRPGYVKVDNVYKMDWRDLERWPRFGNDGECFRLDEQSLKRLSDLLRRKNGEAWKVIEQDIRKEKTVENEMDKS